MNEYIELLKSLVAIPSHSREEGKAADFLQSWMSSRGMDVHRVGNNLWVESKLGQCRWPKLPNVLLNAHIDTVKPASGYSRDPYVPYQEGDRIFGLGTNDDGASLVALLEVYRRLSATDQPYRLVFCASAEEEVTGVGGIEMVFGDVGPIDLGIIGEPTGMRMAVAEKGLLVLDCISHGKSGHAARNEGVNAIYEALQDIDWFRNYHFPKVSPFLGEVKMTVTMIQSGTQHNVIPDTCKFTVDVRPNGEYSNAEIVDIIRSNVRCDVQPRSLRNNSSSIPAEHPVVRRGLALGLEQFGSPTTSNQTRCDFPTLKIGPGDSARSHTADEFIDVKEISDSVDIFFKLLDGLELKDSYICKI